MSQRKSHDQNFKNLILDYPHDALEFFAAEEAEGLSPSVTITPIRQEQLKERLGDRFHELDVPLLVEWPDGQREALLLRWKKKPILAASPSTGWRITPSTLASYSPPTGWCPWLFFSMPMSVSNTACTSRANGIAT